jgi:Uma2 family endonuclease
MAEAVPRSESMTVDEFLRFIDSKPERENQKWELHDGAPVMMVGGTAAHAIIAGNIDRALFPQARERGCEVMRGFLASAGDRSAFEPDVVVRCGPMNPQNRYAADPVVVFEVLSPSTMRYDRGIKLEGYRGIPSLRQIVFIYQDSIRLESWSRDGGDWAEEPVILLSIDEALPIPALATELPLRMSTTAHRKRFGPEDGALTPPPRSPRPRPRPRCARPRRRARRRRC